MLNISKWALPTYGTFWFITCSWMWLVSRKLRWQLSGCALAACQLSECALAACQRRWDGLFVHRKNLYCSPVNVVRVVTTSFHWLKVTIEVLTQSHPGLCSNSNNSTSSVMLEYIQKHHTELSLIRRHHKLVNVAMWPFKCKLRSLVMGYSDSRRDVPGSTRGDTWVIPPVVNQNHNIHPVKYKIWSVIMNYLV